ncbi:unnamed protein product [Arctogadus glacialis]
MRSLLPLTVYCISLLTLQPHSLQAVPVADHPVTDRSDLLQRHGVQSDTEALVQEATSDVSAVTPSPAVRRPSESLAESLKRVASANARAAAVSSLAWARPDSGRRILRRSLRTRRNAHHRQHHRHHHHHNSPHSKSNKDGCPLGTCSVHNLSHRLYQLIGQSGREDSPKVNPMSPHSFG